MIQYMLTGHFFNYEVQTTIQVFYPNRNYFLCDVVQQTGITIESILTDAEAIGCLYIDGQKIATHTTPLTITDTDVKDLKMAVKRCLFVLLKEYKHEDMPWGALTGIRPTKRVFELWRNVATDEQILKLFQESYYISPE